MFEKLRKSVDDIVEKVTKTELKPKNLNPLLEEFKLILIENDVALSVAEKICDDLKQRLAGVEVKRFEDRRTILIKALRDTLITMLKAEHEINMLQIVRDKKSLGIPAIIVFVGINGTGKTTTIAKVAKLLINHGYTVVIACSDTFRAGAIEQLEEHAKRLGIRMIKRPYGADAASVAFDAISHA
ncbi:MAG TPA: signal recognition particle receptor subunit alpha, partial [archaeon]|nr:signal recognition particle receptor subunit alpha [archaeon]